MSQATVSMRFELVDFNPRRHARGAEGARVRVFEGEQVIDVIWMSPRDVRKNIGLHGRSSGLAAVEAAYKTPNREIRDGQPVTP